MIGVIKTPLDAALEIAAGGVPVFPCGANKRPLTPHGFKDATCNDEIISDWWKRWPQANVAIPTGEMSDKVVLDVDMDKAKGKDGENTLAALTAKHGELPKTQKSGSRLGDPRSVNAETVGFRLSACVGVSTLRSRVRGVCAVNGRNLVV